MMRVYNTLSGTKEDLPKTKDRLKMFVCGPTVYGDLHIGNGRTFMNQDLIVRYLRFRGYKVFYLQNITDLDDKIIARAAEEGVTWKDIARKYEEVYRKNLKDLGIDSINKYARATDHIKEILKQVQTLIDKGNAYLIEGDGWYFDLSTFPEYGKLSRRTTEQAEDGVSRIDDSDRKRNRGDFCLWKFASPDAKEKNEPVWEAKIGAGRPGWHIEDTAITEHYFGPQYDIHGGGVDIKFPHHEAEIAQQESASGKKPFVRFWMHSGLLLVDGKKMSKSLGNFLTINDVLKEQSPETFRMMALNAHYRSPMDYTASVVSSAAKNIAEMRSFIARLRFVEKKGKGETPFDTSPHVLKFREAMEDDFNTPEAVAVIFGMMTEANKQIWTLSRKGAKSARLWLSEVLEMFGFKDIDVKTPPSVRKLAREREISRVNKQFTQSDALRKEVEALGYTIEDTPLGPLTLPSHA
jgi:cysteinyl-tRNA synthetase